MGSGTRIHWQMRCAAILVLAVACTVCVVSGSPGLDDTSLSLGEQGETTKEKEEVREVAEKAFQDVKLQRDQDRRATRRIEDGKRNRQALLGEEVQDEQEAQAARLAAMAERKTQRDRQKAQANDKEAWEVSKKVFESTNK